MSARSIAMSSRRQPEREYTLQLYPMQLRLGDQFTDADGEWAVVGGPEGMHGGRTERVWVQRPGDPGTKREMTFPAYTKIAVRRSTQRERAAPGREP
jgi:hypothetical protein